MLLDGRYEILAQRPLNAQQTLFEATAPDGAAVRVVWFELTTPEEELAFERYRKLLRALRQGGHAAIYDLVSRPGAHYVAWQLWPHPGDAHPSPDGAASIAAILETHGYRLQDAELHTDGSRSTKVYGLAFEGTLPAPRGRATKRVPMLRLPPWLLSWLPGLVLAALGLALFALSFAIRANNQVVVVPEVVGTEVNAAAERLYRQGLAIATEPVASREAAGTVIGLEPEAGTRLRPGRTVRLRYALPPGRRSPLQVPDLRSRPFSPEIKAEVEAAGLVLGRIARIPSSFEKDLIIAQSLPPGQGAPKGSTLSLLVSEGRRGEMTFLPDLSGQPLELARQLARDAGISPDRIETEWVPSTGETPGTVLGQNLTPFVEVPLETATLRLLVAGADEEEGAPNLIGMSKEEAERTATGYTLAYETLAEPGLPEGVVSQSPAPGVSGETNELRLTLNVHPAPRLISYRFRIEPNIPSGTARIEAYYEDGSREVVGQKEASGGDVLEGQWSTTRPGPVTFVLYLNDIEYTRSLVNP